MLKFLFLCMSYLYFCLLSSILFFPCVASTIQNASREDNAFVETGNKHKQITEIILRAERTYGIDDGYLQAIVKVESGYRPYAINAKKRTVYFKTKSDAEKFIRATLPTCKNISIGCCQLQYRAHHKSFESINDMLDPAKNIEYAASLLSVLYKRHKSWEQAIKMYHTSKPKYHCKYYKRVMNEYRKIKGQNK